MFPCGGTVTQAILFFGMAMSAERARPYPQIWCGSANMSGMSRLMTLLVMPAPMILSTITTRILRHMTRLPPQLPAHQICLRRMIRGHQAPTISQSKLPGSRSHGQQVATAVRELLVMNGNWTAAVGTRGVPRPWIYLRAADRIPSMSAPKTTRGTTAVRVAFHLP